MSTCSPALCENACKFVWYIKNYICINAQHVISKITYV